MANDIVKSGSASDFKDDPLIEVPGLKGSELVKKSHITGIDIKSFVVRCTICKSQINHLNYHKLKRHIRLNVVVCNECHDFYGSDEFTRDDAGKYNYCTWCGNGGTLFVCDFCPNVFCINCVKSNFGRSEVAKMQKDGWKCYVCDPKKLKPKVAYCSLLLEYSKAKNIKEKKAEVGRLGNKELVSEAWVVEAFTRTENACKSLIKKMDKLKHVEGSRSKSLKHVIKKMEEVVSLHKAELSHVMKNLSQQYSSYLKVKQEENDQVKQEEKNQSIKSQENGVRPEIKDKDENPIVVSLASDSDDILAPGKVKSDIKINGDEMRHDISDDHNVSKKLDKVCDRLSFPVDVATDLGDSAVVSDTETKAKKKLFQDSSDSEVDSNEEKSSAKIHNITVTAEVHSSEGGKDLSSDKTLKDSQSKNLNHTVNKSKKTAKACDAKESPISSLSSDSDHILSGFEYSPPDKTKKIAKMKNKEKPSVDVVKKKYKEKPIVEIDYVNDVKLKVPSYVVLERCDHLLKGETTIEVPAAYLLEDIDLIDKTVDSIMKEPQKSKSQTKRNPVKKVQKAGPKCSKRCDSSSSITFSSEDEETKIPPVTPIRSNVTDNSEILAKKALLESDDSSSDSESIISLSSGDGKKKSKKGKRSGKIKSDSSADFQPRKKKKYDKLLNKRIFSDDSGKENKKSSSDRQKRKKNTLESDDSKSDKKKITESDTTSESEEAESKKTTKKRKRIKKAANSSSDKEEEDTKDKDKAETPKKRKDIRKIISKEDLKAETKEAQAAERERKKRIEERQKLYNVITESAKDGHQVITKKMVLEIDPTSKEEIVEVHPDLIEKLKPHQVKGVKFMWECCIESLESLKKEKGSGCILAHCMGLGKTLQVITFLHTCLTNKEVNKVIKTAVVICPYNIVLNWAREFDNWLKTVDSEDILVIF